MSRHTAGTQKNLPRVPDGEELRPVKGQQCQAVKSPLLSCHHFRHTRSDFSPLLGQIISQDI